MFPPPGRFRPPRLGRSLPGLPMSGLVVPGLPVSGLPVSGLVVGRLFIPGELELPPGVFGRALMLKLGFRSKFPLPGRGRVTFEPLPAPPREGLPPPRIGEGDEGREGGVGRVEPRLGRLAFPDGRFIFMDGRPPPPLGRAPPPPGRAPADAAGRPPPPPLPGEGLANDSDTGISRAESAASIHLCRYNRVEKNISSPPIFERIALSKSAWHDIATAEILFPA